MSISRSDVVRVEAGAYWGTGFVIGPGKLLTALHVIVNTDDPNLPLRGDIKLFFATEQDGRWLETDVVGVFDSHKCDKDTDWALIEFDSSKLNQDPYVWEVGPAKSRHKEESWATYGFPKSANKVDGLAASGRIKSYGASVATRVVMQLYSQEAAAGNGQPVQGYSGGPVVSRRKVVGLLRKALKNTERRAFQPVRAEAGTLFATDLGQILPHPCFGFLGGDKRLDQLRAEIVRLLEGQTSEVREAIASSFELSEATTTSLLQAIEQCCCEDVFAIFDKLVKQHAGLYPLLCAVFPWIFEAPSAEVLEPGVLRLSVSTKGFAEAVQARAEGRPAAFKISGTGKMPRLVGDLPLLAPCGPDLDGSGFRHRLLAALYKEFIDHDVSGLSSEDMADALVPTLKRCADPLQTQYRGVYYIFEEKDKQSTWFGILPEVFDELEQSIGFYLLRSDRKQKRHERGLMLILLDAHKREHGKL